MAYRLEINEEERKLLLMAVEHAAQALSSPFTMASAGDRRQPLLAALLAMSQRLGALAIAPEADLAAQFAHIGAVIESPNRHFSLVAEGGPGGAAQSGYWNLPANVLVIRAEHPSLAAYGIHAGDLILVDTERNQFVNEGMFLVRAPGTVAWELLHLIQIHGQLALERDGQIRPLTAGEMEALGQVIWVLRQPRRPEQPASSLELPAPTPAAAAVARGPREVRPEEFVCSSCGQRFLPSRADFARLMEAEVSGQPPLLLCPNCQQLLDAVEQPRPRATRRSARI